MYDLVVGRRLKHGTAERRTSTMISNTRPSMQLPCFCPTSLALLLLTQPIPSRPSLMPSQPEFTWRSPPPVIPQPCELLLALSIYADTSLSLILLTSLSSFHFPAPLLYHNWLPDVASPLFLVASPQCAPWLVPHRPCFSPSNKVMACPYLSLIMSSHLPQAI